MKDMRRTSIFAGIIFLFIFLVISISSNAQVTVGCDVSPIGSSLLDLKESERSSDAADSQKGLLLPRVMLASLDQLDPLVENATEADKLEHTGVLVYHVGSSDICAGVHTWDSEKWNRAPGPCTVKITHGSIQVNGLYEVGRTLTENHTITLDLHVPRAVVGGIYHIYTDTHNGISFSGTGTLTEGLNTITLAGSGVPQKGGSNIFNLVIDISNAENSSAVCPVTIVTEHLNVPTIVGFGSTDLSRGYKLNNSASRMMVTSDNNFGTSANSTVRMEANIVGDVDLLTPAELDLESLTKTNFSDVVDFNTTDILINGYSSYVLSSNSVVINS